MARYEHSGSAADAHLVGDIADGTATAFTLDVATNWPTGATGKFWVAVEPDTPNEEHFPVNARTGTACTLASSADRGAEGTVAQRHPSGSIVRHIWSATEADDVVVGSDHYLSTGAAPSLTVGSGSGTGATASLSGTDTRGIITILTGTGTGSGLAMVVVTFAEAYSTAPAVVITPVGVASANALLYLASAPTATSFTVQGNAVPAASSTLKFTYVVIG